LLADITFDSVFPASQITRERNVILEEMSMYYDDPDDSLQDEFDAIIFSGHALGMNILGTQKTVKNFQRKDFRRFVRAHMDTSKIVFSCVGNLSMEEVVRLAEKHLGRIPKMKSKIARKKFNGYKAKETTLKRNVKQARVAMGRTAYHLAHEKRSGFFMLTNILGGGGMNSQ